MDYLNEPANVLLIVGTLSGGEHAVPVEPPSLDGLTDALTDLYARVGCDDEISGVRIEYDYPDGRATTPGEDPESSPEAIAAYMWEEMVDLRY